MECNFAGWKLHNGGSTMRLENTNFSWMPTCLHSTPPYFTSRGGVLRAMGGRVGLGALSTAKRYGQTTCAANSAATACLWASCKV
jgi:hypothetical protein